MDPIVLATANPHKVAELRAIFAGVGTHVIGLADLPRSQGLVEPTESGRTFEENATIKALSYARQTGRVCLADDSGLEVDALGGAPGVISSHYATDGVETGAARAERDAANNARLLRELADVSPERRSARFVCVMVLAAPLPDAPKPGGTRPTDPSPVHGPEACATGAGAPRARVLLTNRGVFEGRIGEPGEVPRGGNGFGYDPLFLVAPDFARTSAELAPDEKNRLSHRGAAARAMASTLRALSPRSESAP